MTIAYTCYVNSEGLKSFKKALLVDDDPMTNVLNQRLFERYEVASEVDIVTNGQEAIDYLEELGKDEMPDLILLDLNMPVVDGFGFMKIYNERFAEHAGCMILLMLTDQTNETIVKRAKTEFGIDQFIGKPLNKDKVEEIRLKYLK